MSSDANIDYNAVLADLKAQRDKIDAAIAGIETLLGARALSTQPASNGINNDMGPGAFLGMSIVDATKKLLKARRQQLRTEDILKALQDGGLAFKSENPINTVGSVLNRDWNSGGDIVRVARGVWGLAEWHPRLRKRSGDSKTPDEQDESVGKDEAGKELV